jgi:prolyl oligopeptidase PreP (S9A serine peptidase family)
MFKQLDLAADAPWKQRFRAPIFWNAQIAAANPERGLIWTNQSGSMQLHAWNVLTNRLRQLTNQPTGVWDAMIAANGQYVYYFDDRQGSELGHYVRIPFAGGEPEDITPDLPLYRAVGVSDNDDNTVITLDIIDIDAAGREQTYLIYQDSTGKLGQPCPIKAVDSGDSPFSSESGISVAVTYNSKASSYQLAAIEITSQEIVATLLIPETRLYPIYFLNQSSGLKVLVKSIKLDTTRLFIWDIGPNRQDYLPITAHQGNLEIRSIHANLLLLEHTHCAKHRFYIFDLTTRILTQLNAFNGSIGMSRFINDQEILATISDTTYPSRLVILSSNTGQIIRTLHKSEYLPPSRSWISIWFPTTDGLTIQAWLALPLGNPPFPTILHVHGGPASVTTERFDPNCQAWLDHGFAWMSVNYRGSTSFGKRFQSVIQGKPGQLEVEDMVAARDWLIKQGIANPAAILVTGGSYGGYLTLQSLSTTPDLWAGGIAEVAVADWLLMYSDPANITASSVRSYLGGTPEENPKAYKVASPLTYAQQIRAPLLVIQGKYDSRCTPQQMREYERKLISLGKEIQIHWFDNGHFKNDVELQIRHQEIMLCFAHRALNTSLSIFAGGDRQAIR